MSGADDKATRFKNAGEASEAKLANDLGNKLAGLAQTNGPLSRVMVAPNLWMKLASHRGIERNSAVGISVGGVPLLESVHLAPGKALALIGLRPHDLGTFE